ncbi:MAG TPA: ABC transporter permease subunit [Devosiaceae bacterium]
MTELSSTTGMAATAAHPPSAMLAVLGKAGGRLAWALYLVILLAWLVFPIALIVMASFEGNLEVSWSFSNLSLDAYMQIPRSYWEAFRFTVTVAVLATTVSLAIAVPAAWALVRGKLRERRLVSNLVLLPDVVPQLILGIALLTVFIPLRLSNTFAGVLLGLMALNLAMGLRFSEALLDGMPEEFEQAARSLGAGGLTTFRLIVLPMIAPGVAIAALFLFMQNLIAFELLFFIAGPRATPISVLLFTDIVDRGVVPQAVAMSALLVYVGVLFYAAVALLLGPRYLAGTLISRKG